MPSSRVCWSCQGLVSSAFCETCQAIQPLDITVDFFQLLDIPRGFEVDKNRLESNYQALQMRCHPDRFATRTATERRFSLEHVTRLNQAYQTLGNSVLRGGYLLEILGRTTPGSGKLPVTDPDFLLEIMEQREALEEVDLSSPHASDRLDQLRQETEKKIDLEESTLLALFRDYFLSPNPVLLDQAAKALDRCVYHGRFIEALDQAEETLF